MDLLVELDGRGLSLLELIAIKNRLSDALGIKADLVERSTLKPAIGRRILEEVLFL